MRVLAERLSLMPNWVDTKAIRPVPADRSRFGLPEGATIALYAGNLGQKQGLDVLVDAARLLGWDPEILFVFVGDGRQDKNSNSLWETWRMCACFRSSRATSTHSS